MVYAYVCAYQLCDFNEELRDIGNAIIFHWKQPECHSREFETRLGAEN
jgi:hypothetical protein